MKPQKLHLTLFGLALLLASLACGIGGSGSDDPKQATADALANSISLTATAAAGAPTPEGPGFDTGIDSEGGLATAEAQATQQAAAVQATQDALAALNAEELAGTEQALAPILLELPKYGVDPDKGRPAWIHPPVSMDVDGYMQFDYANQYLFTLAEDFVMSADITWNTQYGTSGCGFAFRSNGNKDAFDQYLAIATRGGSGRVIFFIMAQGEVVNAKDIFAYGIDDNFEWQNDTTNNLTVVGRGPIMTIYTNGTKIGEFNVNDPPQRPYIPPPPPLPEDVEDNPAAQTAYDAALVEYNNTVAQINGQYNQSLATYKNYGAEFLKGFVAMVTLSESGRTQCKFDNAWLYLIEE